MTLRRLTALLAGLMLPLLWSTAAFAHAVLQPAAAPAGDATEFQLLIPHGCSEGEPPPPPGSEVVDTRLISLEVPEGVTIDAVADVEGFEIEQTDEAVTWTGTLPTRTPASCSSPPPSTARTAPRSRSTSTRSATTSCPTAGPVTTTRPPRPPS